MTPCMSCRWSMQLALCSVDIVSGSMLFNTYEQADGPMRVQCEPRPNRTADQYLRSLYLFKNKLDLLQLDAFAVLQKRSLA